MAEYRSCMGGLSSPLDRRIRYRVLNKKIQSLRKQEGIFGFLKPWQPNGEFEFDNETRVVICDSKENGSGRITLKNKKGDEGVFFIYQEFNKFISELSHHGLKLNTSL